MLYLGVDLGGTNIKVALVDAQGNILQEASRPTNLPRTAEAVCDDIAALCLQLSAGRSDIGGVGVGCPGTVDDRSGRVLYSNNLAWADFAMSDYLEAATGLPVRYWRKLEAEGIRALAFNPFVPVINLVMNNRDHRKICVIDGNVGFTGGINLADEYINAYEKHGHWKDTSILLKGEAVFNLTVMFLSMWDYLDGTTGKTDYSRYYPTVWDENAKGYVQPFADNPLDDEAVGETVYLNLINKAKRYVYITTPYLILSSEMLTALTSAAKCGVDVRIITPHVPDKWYVHMVTRSHYKQLLEAGVRIFEYTPGFIHAKMFVSDDTTAVVGTTNVDFRSFYLHFECGVAFYLSPVVAQVKDDILRTQNICEEITLEKVHAIKAPVRILRTLLRAFAPLM